MKLQTQIPLNKAENKFDYQSQTLLLGSCFSNNIGQKLNYYKFQSVQNPFGILFHPKAIENLISKSIGKKTYTESDVFYLNGRWHCFDVHSDLSDSSQVGLLNTLNQGLIRTHQQICHATHIVITLGTAWVYRHLEQDKIVTNCHKIPQYEFKKELLSVAEITESLSKSINRLQSANDGVEIIFTLSPVRHLKDGFVENQKSKAHLVTALHALVDEGRATYFPAYEIMMDELRDYRFYTGDMIHPNQVAIDYIWEKFKEVWISENAYSTMEEVAAVQKGMHHKPFNVESDGHRQFLKSLGEKIAYLKQHYPHMIFDP